MCRQPRNPNGSSVEEPLQRITLYDYLDDSKEQDATERHLMDSAEMASADRGGVTAALNESLYVLALLSESSTPQELYFLVQKIMYTPSLRAALPMQLPHIGSMSESLYQSLEISDQNQTSCTKKEVLENISLCPVTS